jgi:hypothetical protein
MIPPEAQRKTEFSPCRKWRYTLWRSWAIEDLTGFENSAETHAHEYVQFIGLNPSTADEVKDDPTIRRCIGFAKAWGYGALCMTNIFAFRATDPEVMKLESDPVGMGNDTYILNCAKQAGIVVAAWGTHGSHNDREDWVKKMFFDCGIKLHHLGLNSDGSPKHPLYLRKDLKPTPF